MGLIRRAVCLVCSSPSATIMIKAGQLMNSEQALNNLFEVAEIQGNDAVKLLPAKDRKEVLDNFGVCKTCTVIVDKAADLKRQLAEVKAELTSKLTKGLTNESDQTAGPKVKDVKVLERQKKLHAKFLECLSPTKRPKGTDSDQDSFNGAETDDAIDDTQVDSTSPDASYESCNSSPESSGKDTVQTTSKPKSQTESSNSSNTMNTLKRRPGRPKGKASGSGSSKPATATKGLPRSSKRVSNRRKKSFYQQSRFSDFVVNPSRTLKVISDKPSLKIKKKRGRKPGTSLKPLATSNKQSEVPAAAHTAITTRTTSLTRVVDFKTTGPQQSTLLKKRTGKRGRPRKVVQVQPTQVSRPTVLPIAVPVIDEEDDESFTPDDDMLNMEAEEDQEEESYAESGSLAILKKVKPNVGDEEVEYMSLLNKTGVVVEDANAPYAPPADVDVWMAEEEMRTGPSIKNDLFVVEYPCSDCSVVCSSAEMLKFHYEREHIKTLSFCYF